MKYSDGAKMFIAGIAGTGLICAVIIFELINDGNHAPSYLYRLPLKSLTCSGQAKVISKQDFIQDLSDMSRGRVLCVERVGEGLWKEQAAK